MWILTLPFNKSENWDDFLFKKTIAPLFVMFFGMTSSIIGSVDVAKSLAVLCEMLFYIFLYFLIIKTVITSSGIRKITITLILCISYFAFDGLYRFLVSKTIWRLGAGDVHTATNMGAFMLQAGIILTISKILFDKEQLKVTKLSFFIILCFMCSAFIFTFSRGAWISLILGCIVFIKYRKVLILPIILIPILVGCFFPDAIINRVKSVFDFSSKGTVELYQDVEIKNTAHLRLQNWKNSLNDILENPILGLGIGSYHGEGKEKGEIAPHNAYFRIWAECGPIAIFGFLWFLVSLALSLLNAIKESEEKWRWLLIGYLVVLVTQSIYMILGDWPYQMYFWVFAGLATATLKMVNKTWVAK